MLENRCLLHGAFCRGTRCSKLALQVKGLATCELFLIHGESTKNAFRSKLFMFGLKES